MPNSLVVLLELEQNRAHVLLSLGHYFAVSWQQLLSNRQALLQALKGFARFAHVVVGDAHVVERDGNVVVVVRAVDAATHAQTRLQELQRLGEVEQTEVTHSHVIERSG